MTSTSVRLENITKIYRDPKTKKEVRAVNDINLTIEPGHFVALLGPSGCGKTTALRMIAGFESPDAGEIYLGDTAINTLMPNQRDTAMVFQSYALLPHYNVFDNIAYGLRIRKLEKKAIRERVMNMLELVEMSGLENRMANQLSGGQQQRVALARALVVEPAVLLFDEPLSNLDAKLRVSMRSEIRKIQQKVGITAVYVTHDQSEAMSIADKIVVMNHGKIVQEDTPRDVYCKPANTFVADFIGEANFLDAVVKSTDVETCTLVVHGAEITVPKISDIAAEEQCVVMLRPEALRISSTGILKGTVVFSVFMGAYQNYQVAIGDATVTINDYNPLINKIYKEGEEVGLDFDVNNLHIVAT